MLKRKNTERTFLKRKHLGLDNSENNIRKMTNLKHVTVAKDNSGKKKNTKNMILEGTNPKQQTVLIRTNLKNTFKEILKRELVKLLKREL